MPREDASKGLRQQGEAYTGDGVMGKRGVETGQETEALGVQEMSAWI